MWVKVIKKFRDKETKELHKVGDKLNLSKKRIDEILSAGDFIQEIKEKDTGKSSESKEEASK